MSCRAGPGPWGVYEYPKGDEPPFRLTRERRPHEKDQECAAWFFDKKMAQRVADLLNGAAEIGV